MNTQRRTPKNKKFLQEAHITKKTKLSELMNNEKAVEILFESGLSCIGCPMAMQETIEEGCKAHGMNDKEIDRLIEKLNKNGKKI